MHAERERVRGRGINLPEPALTRSRNSFHSATQPCASRASELAAAISGVEIVVLQLSGPVSTVHSYYVTYSTSSFAVCPVHVKVPCSNCRNVVLIVLNVFLKGCSLGLDLVVL